MRELTRLRDQAGAFPFVEALTTLAADVRSIVGSGVKLTYAADWSEYSGLHPDDGSGDHFFHLDPLWASPNIDAVGIDNYMPLADWRDDDLLAANLDGARTADDRDAPWPALSLVASISTGIMEVTPQGRAGPAPRSPMARPASPGCSAPRTSPAGGPTVTTSGAAVWNSPAPPAGCRA